MSKQGSTSTATIGLPQLTWKSATCEVCGRSFDYLGKRRPHVCKNGDCQYKFSYKIAPETWFSHQPSLFDK